MIYNCEACGYETRDSTNYKKHQKTPKHERKTKNVTMSGTNYVTDVTKSTDKLEQLIFVCQKCSKKFKQSQGLSRHKKTCGVNSKSGDKLQEDNQKLQEDNQKLQEENEKLKQKNIDKLQEDNQKLEETVKYLKTLVTEAGSITKTSVSALSYVTKNYNNAPFLKTLELKDYEELKSADDEHELVNILIFYYNHGLIAQYFGDFLVKMYRTKNPEEQSLWSSDVARLNYIVKTVVGTHNSTGDKPVLTVWSTDKNGILIKDATVVPMLKYINEKIGVFSKEQSKSMANCSTSGVMDLLAKIGTAAEISRDIDSGIIARDVIRYIAPYFSIDLNSNTLLLK